MELGLFGYLIHYRKERNNQGNLHPKIRQWSEVTVVGLIYWQFWRYL